MYLEMITSCLYNLIYYVCQLSFLGQSVFKLIIVNFSLNLWMNLWDVKKMQEVWNIMRQTFENVKHAQQECAMIYIAVQPNAL